MEGTILVEHPEIIMFALVAAVLVLFFFKKKKKFKKGVIVANTKYVKKTGYFKFLNAKYHLYTVLIKVVCIVLILAIAVLSAQLYEMKQYKEEYNNRDIMLCMDFSPSMTLLNYDLIETMIETVDTLKDERFGITIFDSSALVVVPLTTDYNYVKYALEDLKKDFYTGEGKEKSIYKRGSGNNTGDSEIDDYTTAAVRRGIKLYEGSSHISDALATCAENFKNDDRTKVIIFSTDNLGKGTITTLEEVSNYCKAKNIRVYPIGARTIANNPTVDGQANTREDLVNLAKNTDGKYFDYVNYTAKQINNEIEYLNASSVIKTTYVARNELPEKILPYIAIITLCLFVLDWRVRI